MHKIKKLSLVGLVCLWLVYMVSINHAANQSFEVDSFKQEIKGLEHNILVLNVEATSLQTIERIEDMSKGLSFVQTEDIYYLTDSKEAMALR
ncbi:hypothetical protein HOC14_01585 [bacterium]|nr:hypothetical protein [bacterium]